MHACPLSSVPYSAQATPYMLPNTSPVCACVQVCVPELILCLIWSICAGHLQGLNKQLNEIKYLYLVAEDIWFAYTVIKMWTLSKGKR